jgi:predicted Rossmann-fold nucleotide-binding protein
LKIAIIGTRNPDAAQIALASAASAELSAAGHTIVTGGATGIDHAVMWNCAHGLLNVCLPWEAYNNAIIPEHAHISVYSERRHPVWHESVAKYHPNPTALTRGAFALHARNYGIVEGAHVVLAMPGKADGGTGQGMRIAKGLGITLLVYRTGSPTSAADALRLVHDRVLSHAAWGI